MICRADFSAILQGFDIFHHDRTLIIPIRQWKAHAWQHEVVEDITEAKERVDIALLRYINQRLATELVDKGRRRVEIPYLLV